MEEISSSHGILPPIISSLDLELGLLVWWGSTFLCRHHKPTMKNKYMWAKMCRLKNQTICINWYSDMYIISGNLFFFKCTRLRLLDGAVHFRRYVKCLFLLHKENVSESCQSLDYHFSSSPKALKKKPVSRK